MPKVPALLTLLFALTAVAEPRRRLFVFEDITLSLAFDQADAVKRIVDAIIDKAPPGTEITVVPICENTEGAEPFTEPMPFPKGTSKLAYQDAQQKRKDFERKITDAIREIQIRTRAGKTSHASCISPALRVVNNSLHGKRRGTPTDVIFVSDMVEECRMSLLGEPVRLKHSEDQFKAAARLVNKAGALMNLSNVRVIVIMPKGITTTTLAADYPMPAERQSFWQRLFERSGITGDRFWWDAPVDQYIESLHE